MESPSNSNQMLTTREAAERLGVKEQTLGIWRCVGRYNLPYCKIGRSVRYRAHDVEQFIQSRCVGAPAN